MMYSTVPEVHFTDLAKERGLFCALKDIKNERDMWRAINTNYNAFFRSLNILKDRSWVRYLDTRVHSVIDDKILAHKGVYVLHRFKLSDDIAISDFEKHLKHIAEKMVLSADFQIKTNQEKIMSMGVENYLRKRRKNVDYMQSTKDIVSEKDPLTRFRVYYENGMLCMKIFFEEMPIRYFKPIKPKPNQILIGMDSDYQPIWWDWTKDINILIAGATGMGKTTLLHVLLMNILTYNTADLYLIDRKNSDLKPYEHKKNVIAFGADAEEGVIVIQAFYDEWQRRKALLQEGGKNYLNVEEYNADHPSALLRPYALVIDEFADIAYECMKGGEIIMDSPLGLILKEAAQIRNTGGHNIIATQRPSADILKGILKAQFSAQIGFRTANEATSKVILDETGLENINKHCFIARLEGKLVEGISYYLDTPMIKERLKALPEQPRPSAVEVKRQARESILEKIAQAEKDLIVAQNYITQREAEVERGLKSAPINLDKAHKKHQEVVTRLETLREKLKKLQ